MHMAKHMHNVRHRYIRRITY